MSQRSPQIALETVQALLWARLWIKVKKPLSRKAVDAYLVQAITPPCSPGSAQAVVQQAWEASVRADQVTAAGELQLTAAGEAALARWLAVARLSQIKTWRHAQQLVALRRMAKPADADGLAAQILSRRHGLGAVKSAAAAVDRLAWRALGVERELPFTPHAVQRYLLREMVPEDARVTPELWRRMLAMRALSGDGHDAQALTRALLANPAAVEPAPVRNDNAGELAAHTHSASLADFACAVQAAARRPGVARFHEDRAYIASVWEQMRGESPVGDMSLADFKNKLIAAHRERLLEITRADLIAAMDAREVERSEAHYQNASFHFVTLDAGGTR